MRETQTHKSYAFGLFCNTWNETAFDFDADHLLTGLSTIISQHKKPEKNPVKSFEFFIYENSGNTDPP